MLNGTKTALNAIEQAIDEYSQEIKRLEAELHLLEKMRDIALKHRPSMPAGSGQTSNQSSDERDVSYPWTKLINETFDECGQLSMRELRRLLVERGYPANEKKYKAAIHALVVRQLGKKLERVGETGSGIYRKIGFKEQMNLEDEVKMKRMLT